MHNTTYSVVYCGCPLWVWVQSDVIQRNDGLQSFTKVAYSNISASRSAANHKLPSHNCSNTVICDFLAQIITFSSLSTNRFEQKQQFVFSLPPSVELQANHAECVVCLWGWQRGGHFVSKHKSCLPKHTICQFGSDVTGRLCVVSRGHSQAQMCMCAWECVCKHAQ